MSMAVEWIWGMKWTIYY